MYSMPRTFLLWREEPTSGKNDSCHPENKEYYLIDSAAEAGVSLKPDRRVFEGENIMEKNSTNRMTIEIKPLQERNSSNPPHLKNAKVLGKSREGNSRQSSLDILATAAAQCSSTECTDPHESERKREKNSESCDLENVVPLNFQQKLPSFATLAYNMVRNFQTKPMSENIRQERENQTTPRPGILSASSQSSLAITGMKKSPRKSPKKNSAKSGRSVTHGKENIPTSTNGENKVMQDASDTIRSARETNISNASAEYLKMTNSNVKVTEHICKNSTNSPTDEARVVLKPKIWNPLFHEYTPKKQISDKDLIIKTEPVSDPPDSFHQISVVETPAMPVTKRSLIKHTVESMIKKEEPSVDDSNVTIKRLLPRHEEEPNAKKIKLENSTPSVMQLTQPLTESKTPSKFPIIKAEYPTLYKIPATPTRMSPYFQRVFEPSPKTFADVALRPLMPPLQRCALSPFSPSFGRADNLMTPELYKSPLLVQHKIDPTSSQSNLDTPLKSAPVSVYGSPSVTSSKLESPVSRPNESVFAVENKPSLARVLAPKFADLKTKPEKITLSNEHSAVVELVNGGFGIKNPSYSAPKPSDITNIQQDLETGKGKYVCKICSKEFGLQRLLNRHLKCHSDVKRYLCTFCGKGFNDTFDLKRHTRIHTGVKPYSCSECDRSFTQRCSLESHCRKVHNMDVTFAYKQRRNKIYVCEECGHSTPDASNHFVHLRENHPNNPALSKYHDRRQFKFSMENQQNIQLPRT
ncbi:histone-lysine N-methyltransferase MECOM-like [Saccostrea echinata]|uniref:histone-lysine N-methyltransferase MECOM-like n=1 Tax=Saccostrea echinata TaxID=191078 RepID=UPI002A81E831|nr:histone-lysine N-methyltransferase MECOM-like [Saccostrea echinata]